MRPAHALVAAARAVVLTAVLTAAVACVPTSRYHEPQLPLAAARVPGADATAASLVGDWTGQFDAPYYARRGALRLSLRRIARVDAGAVTSTVAGTVTLTEASTRTRLAIDSARVGPSRVVLFLAPYADQETAATVQLRLDGTLAADTLGGRLRGDAAATVPAERHGGWRVVRVAPTVAAPAITAAASRAP